MNNHKYHNKIIKMILVIMNMIDYRKQKQV
jgi:hypothetical protein